MKNKGFILLLAVMMWVVSLMPSYTVQAEGQPTVQLYSAQFCYDHYDRSTDTGYYNLTGFIAIEDIAYDKSVTVEYKNNKYGVWSNNKSINAHYMKDDPLTGQDIFRFEAPVGFEKLTKFGDTHLWFRIKYTVNGQTYYDDNNGQGYHVIGTYYNQDYYQEMIVSKCVLKGWGDRCSALLQDLGNDKKVMMRYTDNGWASYKEVELEYVYTFFNGQELWAVERSNMLAMPREYEYALYYQVNGSTYWDNNFGENYRYRKSSK